MKIVAIIVCRYNSSRLPGKILKEVKGRSILENIVLRLGTIKAIDQIVIATSVKNTDDPIIAAAVQMGLNVYRGDLQNVSERVLNTALHHKADYFLRVNGDNLFVDTATMSEMIMQTKDQEYDLITNVPGRTFPFGMSIEIIKTRFYQKMYAQFKTESDYEHVTKYLYDHKELGKRYLCENTKYPALKGVQMAIDTLADYNRAMDIVAELDTFPQTYDMEEIANCLKKMN